MGMLAVRAWVCRESGVRLRGAGCGLWVPSRGLPPRSRCGGARFAS